MISDIPVRAVPTIITGDFNPFQPNRVSHPYQMDQSIYVVRIVGWYFSFLFKF